MNTKTGLTVGVIGATGYAGGELCRLLLNHPHVTRIVPTARRGETFEHIHPNLLGSALTFSTLDALKEEAAAVDVVFFCTPSGQAMQHAAEFLDQGCRVIDLGADFRFSDPATYKSVYGIEHTASGLLGEAVYGATELHRDRIAQARLVANPGCYVITALLALTPVLRSGWADLDHPIHIAAVNGTTGAGSAPARATMHAEAFASMLPYSLDGHRHAPELETHLAAQAGRSLTVDLSTAHGNFARGIYAQASLRAHPARRADISRDELIALLTQFYGKGSSGEYFIRVIDSPKSGQLNAKDYDVYPRVAAVAGSNFCHIGADWDPRLGVIRLAAVTDNLVKGAAGSAIQNMNLVFGFEETCALAAYGL